VKNFYKIDFCFKSFKKKFQPMVSRGRGPGHLGVGRKVVQTWFMLIILCKSELKRCVQKTYFFWETLTSVSLSTLNSKFLMKNCVLNALEIVIVDFLKK